MPDGFEKKSKSLRSITEGGEKMGAAEAQSKALRILFPGRKVVLPTLGPTDPNIEVTVYPLGVRHVQMFGGMVENAIERVIGAIGHDKIEKLLDRDKRDGTAISGADIMGAMPSLVPIVCTDLAAIVNECVPELDIYDPAFPHFWLPPLAEAWIEESFMGNSLKVRPWVDLIDKTLAKVTGKDTIGLWDSLSNISRLTDTVSEMSSEEMSASHTEATPTPN